MESKNNGQALMKIGSVYTGCWDTGLSNSKFILRIEKTRTWEDDVGIEGTIQDIFGLASFSGVMTTNRVHFTKLYTKEAMSKGGAAGEIVYVGDKIGEKYVGIYHIIYNEQSGTCAKGSFEMTISKD